MLTKSLISKISPRCSLLAFSSAKPYHPIKRINFSTNEYQCIYRNPNLSYQGKQIGQAIFYGFIPFGLYSAYYLAFLELGSVFNIGLLGLTAGIGLYHAILRINSEGLFVYEFFIDKTGTKFKAMVTSDAMKYENKDLMKMEFEEENIEEKEMVNWGSSPRKKDSEDKEDADGVILSVGKETSEFRKGYHLRFFLNDNSLEDYNEYLTALGKGYKIVMKP